MTNLRDITFVGTKFRSPLPHRIKANGFKYIDCEFAGAVIIEASAEDTVMRRCQSPFAIVDNGADSELTDNVVVPNVVTGLTVWDPDDHADGALTTLGTTADSAFDADMTLHGAAPTIVDDVINGHKVLRFVSASSQRAVTADFPAAASQPYGLIVAWNQGSGVAATQNLVGGKSNNQPIVQILSDGRVSPKASAGGSAQTQSGAVTRGDWHVGLVIFNGSDESRVFVDSLISSPVAPVFTQVDALSGLRLGSSGTGSTPLFDGDIRRVGFIDHYPSNQEIAQLMGDWCADVSVNPY